MADPIVSKQADPLNPKSIQLGNTGAGYGTKDGDLVDYNGVPIKMTEFAPTVHHTLANAKDPLAFLLARGVQEGQNPQMLGAGFDANQYSFGSKNALGMGDPLTSALRGKMEKSYSGTVNDIRDKYYRSLPIEQAKRSKVYQSLADSSLRNKIQKDAQAAEAAAAKKAAKKAKRGGIGGTIGAIGGGIAGGLIGGPTGAMIGSQIGGGAGGYIGSS